MKPKLPERGVSVDQPAVTVVEISDPAIAGQGIELIDVDAVQPTSVPFRAKRVVVRLERGAVHYNSTNQRIRTRTKALRGRSRPRARRRSVVTAEGTSPKWNVSPAGPGKALGRRFSMVWGSSAAS